MPGLDMYDPEDLKNMRDEMGIDDKMVEEYKKKQEQASIDVLVNQIFI